MIKGRFLLGVAYVGVLFYLVMLLNSILTLLLYNEMINLFPYENVPVESYEVQVKDNSSFLVQYVFSYKEIRYENDVSVNVKVFNRNGGKQSLKSVMVNKSYPSYNYLANLKLPNRFYTGPIVYLGLFLTCIILSKIIAKRNS